jgi:hypothetical protein
MVVKVLTGNGTTAYGNGDYSLIGGEELSDGGTWPKASVAEPHSEAIGMLQALFFGLMEKAESPQGERESRSDRDDNRGWRRCRCSSPPSRSKAQRETA